MRKYIYKECKNCNGTGTVPVYNEYGTNDSFQYDTTHIIYYYVNKACYACKGTGKIKTDMFIEEYHNDNTAIWIEQGK